jgi:hypothetical protein
VNFTKTRSETIKCSHLAEEDAVHRGTGSHEISKITQSTHLLLEIKLKSFVALEQWLMISCNKLNFASNLLHPAAHCELGFILVASDALFAHPNETYKIKCLHFAR